MTTMQIVESSDDVEIQEAVNPTLATRELSLYETFVDTGFSVDELPTPTLWRCLVFPKQPKKMTTSGLVLPSSATDAENQLQYIGQIIKIGPLAGRNKQYENPEYTGPSVAALNSKQDPRWLWGIKSMDWVLYGKFAGLSIEYKGQRLLLLNDDEIIAKIDTPDNYQVYL